MKALETQVFGMTMKNPLVMASGTYGFGEELAHLYNPSLCGGISSKGITRYPKPGNPGIRIWETPSGILNSIGLENPGVEHFVAVESQEMAKLGTKVFVNLGGNTLEEYVEAVELLEGAPYDVLELNISCPNVKEGGMAFGLRCDSAALVTREVVKRCSRPVVVKLSPNGESVAELARAVEAEGAQGVSLVNTFLGMAIDVTRKAFVFDRVTAGLSGPAIRPIALRMVYEVAHAVDIPVMGLGGIATWEDVVAFMMAGARCVQIGTSHFANPRVVPEILEGLEEYCAREGLKSLDEIWKVL